MSAKMIQQAEEYIKLFDLQKEEEKMLDALKTRQDARHRQMVAIKKGLADHVGNAIQQRVIPVDHRAVIVVFVPKDGDAGTERYTTVDVVEMVRKL